MPADGSDFSSGTVVGYQDLNEIKKNYRGTTIPSSIQAGMFFSRSSDDRLTHRASASQDYLIFQGEPVCADNQVVCANNQVVVVLPV